MICPTCGVDAMTEGGPCTYCTAGHLDRVKSESTEVTVTESAEETPAAETKPKGKGKK